MDVSLCFEIRFEKNHCRLPGHGCGCPALWLHRGHGQFLLGGEPDPARGRPPVPHDRYVSPADASPGQDKGCSGSSWPFVISSFILFSLVRKVSIRKFLWRWWVIQKLKETTVFKRHPQCLHCGPLEGWMEISWVLTPYESALIFLSHFGILHPKPGQTRQTGSPGGERVIKWPSPFPRLKVNSSDIP